MSVHLRFLQLQVRSVERLDDGEYVGVEELVVDGRSVLSWDEAVECEGALPAYDVRRRSPAPARTGCGSRSRSRRRRRPSRSSTGPAPPWAGSSAAAGLRGRGRHRRRARRRVPAAHRDGRQRPPRRGGQQGRRHPRLADRHPRARGRRGRRVRVAAGAARRGRGGCRALWAAALLPGAGGAGLHRRGAGLADHPLRLPRDRRAERRGAVRLDRDRRDPHPAGDDHDRRREGRGAGHRSAGGADHRPLRPDVAGDPG